MNLLWNKTKDKAPPEEEILLVSSPLGIDLAMRIDRHWYFKCEDNWNTSNLEYWHFNTPTEWTEINISKEFLSPMANHPCQLVNMIK